MAWSDWSTDRDLLVVDHRFGMRRGRAGASPAGTRFEASSFYLTRIRRGIIMPTRAGRYEFRALRLALLGSADHMLSREQRIYIAIEVIEREAGTRSAVDAKGMKQRLRAMISAAQGHSIAVEPAADRLGREAFDSE